MKARILAVMVCVMVVVNFASADFIRGINVDFVIIGNAGNAGDTRPEAYPSGCGAVDYFYRIGKYEITAAQWQTINAAAGIGDSGGWSGDQPSAWISCYDAVHFCNYLTSGDKNLGPYQIGTDGHIIVDRASAMSTYGTIYVLPTEDEWYKAAYYKPDGSGYSTYANGEGSIPPADEGWNGYGGAYSTPWDVGTGTQEQNGTFDMMGNVREWNEKVFPEITPNSGFRGGSYAIQYWFGPLSMSSTDPSNGIQSWREESYVGFRIASVLELPLAVEVDIKPGSCPNPLTVKSKGVLPVAILGSEDFDVFDIDPASIRLEDIPAVRSSYEDVATPVADGAEICECITGGPDGYLDLTLKFDVQEIVAALGEVNDGDEFELILTGELNNGMPIEGKDCILIISKGKPE